MYEKFEIINFLDNCRWNNGVNSNYGLINFSKKQISNDFMLLTHWISYITDRQMKFEQIWDVGGFVFSDLLYKYKNSNKGLGVLNPDKKNSNFIRINNKYTFISDTIVSDAPNKKSKELLNKYGFSDDDEVRFISRFYPADYVSMFYTLHTLEKYNKDFISYILEVLYNVDDYSPKSLIRTLAYALYILTYDNIGQPSEKDLVFDSLLEKAKSRTKNIFRIINNREILRQNTELFYDKENQYGIKRIWCCIRDYIKSEEFGIKCFKAELIRRKVDKRIINNLFSEEAKAMIELPGDVWNNNATFRNCLFKDIELTDKEKKMSLNKLLRQKYEEYEIKVGYPEQFDVTFNFVPRMCEKGHCDICPFRLTKEKNNLDKICVNNKNKYCTVAQICCDYKCMCNPDKCVVRKMLNK